LPPSDDEMDIDSWWNLFFLNCSALQANILLPSTLIVEIRIPNI
jgi:hypothetical protein